MNHEELPVAIIGAGPIGLAAAANLALRGIPFRIYEAGETAGTNVRNWSHVRVFTTWEQNVDPASARLLLAGGWTMPEPDALPTGGDLYELYLKPLSRLPSIASNLRTGASVRSISRLGVDKITSRGREAAPFIVRLEPASGRPSSELARAVIDASGTWHNPNPLGADGLVADGERAFGRNIAYGMPDVLGIDRPRYTNKRVGVVGGGYSAVNVILDLVELSKSAPSGSIAWILRGNSLARVYGGGEADELPARGRLGTLLKRHVAEGRVDLVRGFRTFAVSAGNDGLSLVAVDGDSTRRVDGLDEIVACTGQRPDLTMTRELRLKHDPWLEGVEALGPLIDPNLHSCGTVPPHGHREVSHPEPGFYTIGVKSYGRAPTFLLMTGYEQARSVAAAIAGDLAAADKVELVLPQTGICSTDVLADGGGCCGGPPRLDADACCVADELAKAVGKTGCGCGVAA